MKVWVADNQKLTHRYAAQHAPEQELKPQVHRWGLKPPTHMQEAHVHEAYMLTTLNQAPVVSVVPSKVSCLMI